MITTSADPKKSKLILPGKLLVPLQKAQVQQPPREKPVFDGELESYYRMVNHWLRVPGVYRTLSVVRRWPTDVTLHQIDKRALGKAEMAHLIQKILGDKQTCRLLALAISNTSNFNTPYLEALSNLSQIRREAKLHASAHRAGLILP